MEEEGKVILKNIFEIVYLIYENKHKTIELIAKELFISVEQVESLVIQAKEEGFIHDLSKLTEKGIAFLEAHRVDNAIIMAAGFGSRFVPMTYTTPKGLLDVHGEVMVERQIKQLHEAGIKDITIVVGYLKESFSYLKDKYGVKLIENPEYSVKNNISTLYYAKEEMKNTYLLTSDIFMTKNIYREFEYNSFYASEFFEEATDEWALEIDQNNLITHVNDKGGAKTWTMYGPAFFTKEFSDRLMSLIMEVYDKEESAQWYWEDVYMRNMDKLNLYIRKYPKGTILEFESLEELRAYDESYLSNSRSDVLDTIVKVFDVDLKDIVNFRNLKAGMTNDSFLFDIQEVTYVFRNPGVGTGELISREQEAMVYSKVKDLGITDEVIFLEPQKGYKITKFIKDSRVIDTNNEDEVKLAFDRVRTLHNSGIKVDHEFDIEERIQFYLKLTKENNGLFFDQFDNVYDSIKKVIDKLKAIPRNKVLCHIDTVFDNFLLSGKEVVLLDWEYAGMADPLIDVAMYIVYLGLQDDEIQKILNLYLERESTDEELMITQSYVALAGFLWSLWTLYKEALGDEFGDYGRDQFNYAVKYSQLVLETDF